MWVILILYFTLLGLGLLVNHQWSKMNREYDKEMETALTQDDKKSRLPLAK